MGHPSQGAFPVDHADTFLVEHEIMIRGQFKIWHIALEKKDEANAQLVEDMIVELERRWNLHYLGNNQTETWPSIRVFESRPEK